MPRVASIFLTLLAVAASASATTAGVSAEGTPDDGRCAEGVPLPALPEPGDDRWVGPPAPSRADLEGRVVLINVWTFG